MAIIWKEEEEEEEEEEEQGKVACASVAAIMHWNAHWQWI